MTAEKIRADAIDRVARELSRLLDSRDDLTVLAGWAERIIDALGDHVSVADWQPGRWYRLRDPDGRLWMESSDREENEMEARRTGYPLERTWDRIERRWRTEAA